MSPVVRICLQWGKYVSSGYNSPEGTGYNSVEVLNPCLLTTAQHTERDRHNSTSTKNTTPCCGQATEKGL